MGVLQKPFPVARTRAVLAVSLLVSFVLIGQDSSITLFGIGILLALATVLLGFAFNNVPRRVSVKGAIYALLATIIITGLLVWVSIVIAPVLATLGR
jgi:hypothetical protein